MSNSSGMASDNVSTTDESPEIFSSSQGSLICPSVSCCIHVLSLQVAVAVGIMGNLLVN